MNSRIACLGVLLALPALLRAAGEASIAEHLLDAGALLPVGGEATVQPAPSGVEIAWTPQPNVPLELTLAQPFAMTPAYLALRGRVADGGGVDCAFLLEDARHRRFSYASAFPLGREWTRGETRRIGGEVRGTGASRSWDDPSSVPEPPFVLIGIRLSGEGGRATRVQLHAVEAEDGRRDREPGYWGVMPLFPVVGKGYFEFTDAPSLYADRLLEKPGRYRVALSASAVAGGDPVWGAEQVLDFDPAAPGQGVALPLPKGFYWVTARVRDAATGDYLYQRRYRVDVERRRQADVLSAPVSSVGIVFSPARPGGVFPAGEDPAFLPQIPASEASSALEYSVADFERNPVIPAVPWNREGTGALRLPAASFKAGEAYWLKVVAKQGGKVVDEAEALFGVASPAAEPVVSGDVRPADPAGPIHVTMLPFWSPSSRGGTHYPFSEFEALVELARKEGAACFHISLNWPSLEPLPGVYRFELLDRMVSIIEKAGMQVGFEGQGFAVGVPEWLFPCAFQTTAEGEVHDLWGREARVLPAPSDPRTREAMGRLWHRVAAHYASDPQVVGYTFAYYFDHFYTDAAPRPGPEARGAFQEWLKRRDGGSLDALNQRWGTAYRSWDEADFPAPAADARRADLRPAWIDAVRFKDDVFRDYVRAVTEGIRSATPRPWIQMYWMGGARNELAFDLLKIRGGFMGDGGNEAETSIVGTSNVVWARGLPEIQESILQMPRNRYNVDMAFVRLLYGGQGAYFRCLWNLESAHNEALRAEWLDCFDYLARTWKPVLEKMKGASSPPVEVGVLETRGVAGDYISSYAAAQFWCAGALANAFPVTHLLPGWFDEDATSSVLGRLRVVFVSADSQVLSGGTISALSDWVRKGGRLVLTPSGGRWSLDAPGGDFALLQTLGISLRDGGKRLYEGAIHVPAGEVFRTAADIPLAGQGLDGLPGFQEWVPEGKFQALAAFPNGSPALVRIPVGAGEALLFLQAPDWDQYARKNPGDRGALDDVARWGGAARCFGSDRPEFRLSLLRQGDARFLLVHRLASAGIFEKPTSFNLSQARLDGMVTLPSLEAGSYRVRELTRPEAPWQELSAAQLAAPGLPVAGMVLGETRVLELSPLTPHPVK